MFGLAVLIGCAVGVALGLTGGGGGVFAVPLLVYGLAITPREAVGISLASVGGTAFVGLAPRLLHGDVELRTGLLFSGAGMAGAPIGTFLSTKVPETFLLLMFSAVMLAVAWQMWSKIRRPQEIQPTCEKKGSTKDNHTACRRDEQGTLRMTSRCAWLLVAVGVLTGVLAGMFGVGGGFVIVPALVLVSGMEIHRAVGTSLFVIVLISISGVLSHIAGGRAISTGTTIQFLAGGIAGIWLGSMLATRLSGPTLQKVFATAVVLVAGFVIVNTIVL